MIIFLSLTEHGFQASIMEAGDTDTTELRSAKAYYEFLHYFEDECFIFCKSLDTLEHRKLWVRQALAQLNILHGLNWTPSSSESTQTMLGSRVSGQGIIVDL